MPRKGRHHYPKWEKYYQGPFEVMKETGPLNYLVQKLPRGRSFVVHVDKLTPYLTTLEADSEITESPTDPNTSPQTSPPWPTSSSPSAPHL